MFGPTTWICLPGNGWKERSPWMSQSSARWLGGDPPTSLLLEWTKVHGEDPGQAHISPKAPSGPLSLAASAVTLCLAHSRHRTVAPLESKNKQMAAS